MYGEGGFAYIYLCYGIHHLFNVVTNRAGIPHAILIRAGFPSEGKELMLVRRRKEKTDKSLLSGPGSLSKAMGITTSLSGTNLSDGAIWIEDHGMTANKCEIDTGPRVGVDYAEEDAARPYRFIWTSP